LAGDHLLYRNTLEEEEAETLQVELECVAVAAFLAGAFFTLSASLLLSFFFFTTFNNFKLELRIL
jgi:hypothetical protein